MQVRRAFLTVFATALMSIPPAAHADFILGSASSFAVLYEGTGGHTVQITNVTINGTIGVGGTGKVSDSGPSTIKGSIDFSAANTGQFSSTNGSNVITGTENYSDSVVTSALTTINSLSSTLGGESGTSLSLANGNQTVNVSSGKLDASGNRVFTMSSFSDVNGNILTINGDAAHDNVVFNFSANTNFNGAVVLNGLDPDQVIFNFTGTGHAAAINTNASSYPSLAWQGIILDPNGAISLTNAKLTGRLFGGDSTDMQIVSGSTLTAPVPEPSTLAISALVAIAFGIRGLRKPRA